MTTPIRGWTLEVFLSLALQWVQSEWMPERWSSDSRSTQTPWPGYSKLIGDTHHWAGGENTRRPLAVPKGRCRCDGYVTPYSRPGHFDSVKVADPILIVPTILNQPVAIGN
jgi:hypothetical protein